MRRPGEGGARREGRGSRSKLQMHLQLLFHTPNDERSIKHEYWTVAETVDKL